MFMHIEVCCARAQASAYQRGKDCPSTVKQIQAVTAGCSEDPPLDVIERLAGVPILRLALVMKEREFHALIRVCRALQFV